MSKLNFRLQLPIAQFLVALTLLVWGCRSPQPAGLDFPYSPTVTLVCKGINAPAALFSEICDRLLPIDRPDRAPVSIFGFGSQDILFLFGVIVLWYLVGQTIDQKVKQQTRAHERSRGSQALIQLVLMILGVPVLLVGLAPILDRRAVTNTGGATVAAILWIIWSLVLFFWPGMNLVRGIRKKGVAHPSH